MQMRSAEQDARLIKVKGITSRVEDVGRRNGNALPPHIIRLPSLSLAGLRAVTASCDCDSLVPQTEHSDEQLLQRDAYLQEYHSLATAGRRGAPQVELPARDGGCNTGTRQQVCMCIKPIPTGSCVKQTLCAGSREMCVNAWSRASLSPPSQYAPLTLALLTLAFLSRKITAYRESASAAFGLYLFAEAESSTAGVALEDRAIALLAFRQWKCTSVEQCGKLSLARSQLTLCSVQWLASFAGPQSARNKW